MQIFHPSINNLLRRTLAAMEVQSVRKNESVASGEDVEVLSRATLQLC